MAEQFSRIYSIEMRIVSIIALLFGILSVSEGSPAEVRKALTDQNLTPDRARALRATAFLVDHRPEAFEHLPSGPIVSLRPLSINEVSLSSEQIAELLEILGDRHTYIPDMMKACVPSFELGVTIASTKGYFEARFCLGCDVVSLLLNDARTAVEADIDRGHNKLLAFFRGLYPTNETLKQIEPNQPEKCFSEEIAIQWAEMTIPDDPLLKRLKAMKPGQRSDELIEEIASKATAAMRGESKKKRLRRSR